MDRSGFLGYMLHMANPVLDAAAKGELRKRMTVEQKTGVQREPYACLEAVGRMLYGMAPWFEAKLSDPKEQNLRDELLNKARLAIAGQFDPASDDYADFVAYGSPYSQLLVDMALLAQGMLRAPSALLDGLSVSTKANLLTSLERARAITPCPSNWVLFSTEVELLYHRLTGNCTQAAIKKYFHLVDSWYMGDGWYGDGPYFSMDYYNSLVIHPMLLDLCDHVPDILPMGAPEQILARAQRHGEILEHLVAPDGSFIAVGRSLAYRCGVFHLLAQLTWQNRLPGTLSPSAVREALYAVTEKTLCDASYREDGFLRVGLCGTQPGLGEGYICTGSLYNASPVFLPLGINANDPFWTAPPEPWTQRAVWNGTDRNTESALEKRN